MPPTTRSSATTTSTSRSSTGCCPPARRATRCRRTPADNQTVRNVFVIGPDKKVKLILVYPMTTGRNFDEVLRVIDSLQLTAKHRVATPAQWQDGDDVIIAGSVSNDEAKEIFGQWEEPGPTSGSSRSRSSARQKLNSPRATTTAEPPTVTRSIASPLPYAVA